MSKKKSSKKKKTAPKNVLELSPLKARSFFLKGTTYCDFEFDALINGVSKKLDGKKLRVFHKQVSRKDEYGHFVRDTKGKGKIH